MFIKVIENKVQPVQLFLSKNITYSDGDFPEIAVMIDKKLTADERCNNSAKYKIQGIYTEHDGTLCAFRIDDSIVMPQGLLNILIYNCIGQIDCSGEEIGARIVIDDSSNEITGIVIVGDIPYFLRNKMLIDTNTECRRLTNMLLENKYDTKFKDCLVQMIDDIEDYGIWMKEPKEGKIVSEMTPEQELDALELVKKIYSGVNEKTEFRGSLKDAIYEINNTKNEDISSKESNRFMKEGRNLTDNEIKLFGSLVDDLEQSVPENILINCAGNTHVEKVINYLRRLI